MTQRLDDRTGEAIPFAQMQRESQRDWMFGRLVALTALYQQQKEQFDALLVEIQARKSLSPSLIDEMVRQAREDAEARHQAFVGRSFLARLRWLVTGR